MIFPGADTKRKTFSCHVQYILRHSDLTWICFFLCNVSLHEVLRPRDCNKLKLRQSREGRRRRRRRLNRCPMSSQINGNICRRPTSGWCRLHLGLDGLFLFSFSSFFLFFSASSSFSTRLTDLPPNTKESQTKGQKKSRG